MKSSLADGVLVFQLPSLDKRKLESFGQPLANWPEEAGQMMDGRVPPIMAMLMFGDAKDGKLWKHYRQVVCSRI